MRYVLDFLAFTPAIKKKLYIVYNNKMEALISSGKFSNQIPTSVSNEDSLLVGVFGNPFSRAINNSEAKLSFEIIKQFSPNKVYVLLEDIHDYTFTKKAELVGFLSDKNTILTYWNTPESSCFKENSSYWLPHHVKIPDYRNRFVRKNGVFVYGAMGAGHYPEREKYIGELESHNMAVHQIQHPGYTLTKNSLTGDKLSELISSYSFGMVSPSKFEYCVGKYFEIAACDTALVGLPCSDSEALGFKVIVEPWDTSKEQVKDCIISNAEIMKDFALDKYVEKVQNIMK